LLTAGVSPRTLTTTSAALRGNRESVMRRWPMTYRDWGALIGFTIGVIALFL
jgi:hypothetical protein